MLPLPVRWKGASSARRCRTSSGDLVGRGTGMGVEGPLALVVDDDDGSRRLVAALLARAGWSCVVASDGMEALAVAQTVRPGLAVIDLMLPGMTGLDVALRIKRSFPSVALAGISGWPELWGARDLSSVGISRVFGKPFDALDFIEWARAVVRTPAGA